MVFTPLQFISNILVAMQIQEFVSKNVFARPQDLVHTTQVYWKRFAFAEIV